MRIYANCNEAIKDIGRELKKCATTVHTQTYQNKDISKDDNFVTKEIQAYSFAVLDSSDKDRMPNVTLEWCKAEISERTALEPVNPGKAYLLRREVWDEFLVDGEFEYTYSERMWWQIEDVVNELKKRPETRQAIIEIHQRDKDQFVMGIERVPCSMYYHFMIRDGKLDVIYTMRSSDFATHFQNDIWLAIALRDLIAAELTIAPGKFIMFVSSLHIYKKDWNLLSNY
jgi:thymidylate synthase